MSAYRDMVIRWSKDLGGTIDSLETRPDIDAAKVGYYGISAGAHVALPIIAVEPRPKRWCCSPVDYRRVVAHPKRIR